MNDTNDTNDTPITSEGFGLSSDIASHVAEPTLASDSSVSSERKSFESDVSGFKFNGLRAKGIELASSLSSSISTSVGQQAKSNPLLLAGVVGVGALAAGYVFGRLMAPKASIQSNRAASGSARSSSLNQEPERFPAYID